MLTGARVPTPVKRRRELRFAGELEAGADVVLQRSGREARRQDSSGST